MLRVLLLATLVLTVVLATFHEPSARKQALREGAPDAGKPLDMHQLDDPSNLTAAQLVQYYIQLGFDPETAARIVAQAQA
jgi:hypothetical protein